MSTATALDAALAILDGARPMPRCAVCARAICEHRDLEFAGLVPASQSTAAPSPGGSGPERETHALRADTSPRSSAREAAIKCAALKFGSSAADHQTVDHAFHQHTNLNRTFHGGGIG